MNIQIECIVFRIIDNNIQYLLLKRKKEKGDFWQPVCGRLEKGESHLQCLYRELHEETGIIQKEILRIIQNAHNFIINKHYLTNEPIPEIIEYAYGVEVDNSAQINITNNQSNEHEDFAWVNYTKAIEMLKWKDNKTAFEKLNKILGKL